MKNIVNLSTAQQYDNLSEEQLLRLLHAGLLIQGQQIGQILTIVQTIVDLLAIPLSVQEKEKLQQTDLSPEPLPAIQRKLEETQQELAEDLRNGIYEAGL